MVEYIVRNDFKEEIDINVEKVESDTGRHVTETIIPPGNTVIVQGTERETIRIQTISDRDCQIGFETDEETGFRLGLKRNGKTWTLKPSSLLRDRVSFERFGEKE